MAASFTQVRRALRTHADPAKAKLLKTFFKTGKGQYGEHDKFWGIPVPVLRTVARQFTQLPLRDISVLLKSPVNEERMTALLILVGQYNAGNSRQRQNIYKFYLRRAARINNWNLVDASAHHIVGAHLHGKDKAVLKRLARSEILWERRIAMVATWHDIQKGEHDTALVIAEILLDDAHDLMHKAVGWMLREVGKRSSQQALEDFLRRHHKAMSRTTLRYAIERFPLSKRRAYLYNTPYA